ncbi:MAG: two-component regulator propeller domain-containing protein, partial [Bacteroidota bacterium]
MIDARQEPELAKITAGASFYTDPLGQIWAINPFGVYSIRLEESKFDRLLYDPQTNKFATRNLSTDDAGQLWAVQEGITQLWKVDLEDGTVSGINQSRTVHDKIPIDQMFNALIQQESGHLLFASPNKLTAFDPIDLRYLETDIATDGMSAGALIWALYEDEAGKIWFSTSTGSVGFWDGLQANWTMSLDTIHPPTYGYQFHEDQEGLFWLATDSGLFLLDNKTGEVQKRYWSGGEGELKISFDHVHHFHEDKDGSFWLGTAGTGLVHWNKGRPLIEDHKEAGNGVSPVLYEQYTRAHGLNNVIYAVYEDEQSYLWLSSDNGIIRFHKTTHQIKTYLEADGITHHEFNRNSHHQAADGRLFFGGLNGVTAFHPRDFVADSVFKDVPLVITDFQIFDREGQTSSKRNLQAMEEKSLRFQPDDRFFRLEFALLTYEEVDKNLYAYKVEGVDKDWTYQKENFIRFSRLPYGQHTLRIKGQGVDGQWSAKELTIQMTIVRPFYLRSWFLMTAIFLLIGGTVAFFRWRTARLQRQKRELQAAVNRQTEEIRQQAEELKSLEKLKSRFF